MQGYHYSSSPGSSSLYGNYRSMFWELYCVIVGSSEPFVFCLGCGRQGSGLGSD